jgi:hypothetical protein
MEVLRYEEMIFHHFALEGKETRFVNGESHLVQKDKGRSTNSDKGIVTFYRLTNNFYNKGGDQSAAG